MLFSPSQAQSDQGDEILLAFKEWLKIQEARHGWVAHHPHGNGSSDSHRNEFHVPPGIAPVEPSIGVNPRQASFQRYGISRGRSVGRRVFRTFAYGFIIIVTVGAALAWQSSDDKTKDMVRAWGISLSQLSSVLGTKSPAASDVAAKPVSKTSEQASVAAGSSPEAQHQLETMGSDLAVVRRIVEQLAAKQEQMAQDIATLQAAEQNVSEKKSSLPQSSAVPPRKNMHSEAAVQPPSVPVPTPRPQTTLPSH
jgi:hypothetical protein